MNIFGWFTLETLKEIILHPILARIWEGAVPMAVEKIKKSFEEHRAELIGFIVLLEDGVASANLLRHIREAQAENTEAQIINGLTKLYMFLSSPDELAHRTQLFIDLGRMENDEFKATIFALEHDVVQQWFRRVLAFMKQTGASVARAIAIVTPVAIQVATMAITETTEAINRQNTAGRDALNKFRASHSLRKL